MADYRLQRRYAITMTKLQCQIELEWDYKPGVKEIGLKPAWCLYGGTALFAYIRENDCGKWVFGDSFADIAASVCEEVIAREDGIKCLGSSFDESEIPELKKMVEDKLLFALLVT